jgi:hypothetical protein
MSIYRIIEIFCISHPCVMFGVSVDGFKNAAPVAHPHDRGSQRRVVVYHKFSCGRPGRIRLL